MYGDEVGNVEEEDDLESKVDEEDSYNNETVHYMSSVKSVRGFRLSSGRYSIVDHPDVNEDDTDDLDGEIVNQMTKQASFDEDDDYSEGNILDDEKPQDKEDVNSPSESI